MRNRGWAVLASVVALFACGGGTEPLCSSHPLTVAVTSSTKPTFSWTPNCSVGELAVYEARLPSGGGDVEMWIIVSRTSDGGAPSPVVYGHVPFTMRESATPLPLVAGRTYRVDILKGSSVVIGSRVFGP